MTSFSNCAQLARWRWGSQGIPLAARYEAMLARVSDSQKPKSASSAGLRESSGRGPSGAICALGVFHFHSDDVQCAFANVVNVMRNQRRGPQRSSDSGFHGHGPGVQENVPCGVIPDEITPAQYV